MVGRELGFRKGIVAAVKADTLSSLAFEIGIFGWVAVVQLVRFSPEHLTPNRPANWLFMQIAVILGLLTAMPVNAYLLKHGVKERM